MKQLKLMATLAAGLATFAGSAEERSWIGGESGLWGADANWSPAGVPQNGDAVKFDCGGSCTVTGPAEPVTLAGFTVSGTAVTLDGGVYTNETKAIAMTGETPALTLKGAALISTAAGRWTPAANTRITLVEGATFQPGWQATAYQCLWLDNKTSGFALAVTNSTFLVGLSVRNTMNPTLTFHNATVNATVEMAHSGATAKYNQHAIFSGAESKITLLSGTTVASGDCHMRFEKDVPVTFSLGTGKLNIGGASEDYRCDLTFEGNNEIATSSVFPIYASGELFFGDGVTMTNGFGLVDFGMGRMVTGASHARTVISNATLVAGNQIYMPLPTKVNKEDCGVTFMGDHPLVTAQGSGAALYIGKETPADGEVLPSWRFVLPPKAYALAPMQIQVAARWMPSNDHIYWNTPLEFDVTAVASRTRYPLFTIPYLSYDLSEEQIAMMTEAMSAWAYNSRGEKRDAKERVTLGWDVETKTFYADVAGRSGLTIIVR